MLLLTDFGNVWLLTETPTSLPVATVTKTAATSDDITFVNAAVKDADDFAEGSVDMSSNLPKAQLM